MLFGLVHRILSSSASRFRMKEVVSYLRPSFGGVSTGIGIAFSASEWLLHSAHNDSQK